MVGDRIVSLDGRPIPSRLAVSRILERFEIGQLVPVVVERSEQQTTVSVRIDGLPERVAAGLNANKNLSPNQQTR